MDEVILNSKINKVKKRSSNGRILNESQVICVLGHSTGNETNEWVYLLAQQLALKYPTKNVKYNLYNSGWGAWQDVQNVGEDKHIYASQSGSLDVAYVPSADVVLTSDDIDIWLDTALIDWQQGGNPYVCGKSAGSGHIEWVVREIGSKLVFNWSVDGTNLVQANLATQIDTSAFVDGSYKKIRFKLDVDNGAGGYIITSYTSVDGVTWTQYGTYTGVGAITRFKDATAPYVIGQSGNGNTAFQKCREFHVLDGIGGYDMFPQPITAFYDSGNQNFTWGGTPTIYIYNASIPGSSILNFLDSGVSPYVPKTLPVSFGAMLFINLGLNDAIVPRKTVITNLDSLLTLIKTRANGFSAALLNQNPTMPPTLNNHNMAVLSQLLTNWSRQNNIFPINTFDEFLNTDGSIKDGTIASDGIHPTKPLGEQLILNKITSDLNL